jgi:hypothetical protein
VADGPTRADCALVDERDDYRCTRCGVSLSSTSGSRHHRQLRRHGDHSPANLVLLCGSGTTGCHGWAHANPREARRVGLIVPSWLRAESVPVKTISGWLRLARDGSVISLDADDARRVLADLGMIA